MLAHSLSDTNCVDCGAEDVAYTVKKEATGWKVHVECTGCGRRYGRAGVVQAADVDDADEAYSAAEEMARSTVEARAHV